MTEKRKDLEWHEIQQRFRRFVLDRGDHTMQEIADAIPATRDTVYRLMRQEVKQPTRALRLAVKRLVDPLS